MPKADSLTFIWIATPVLLASRIALAMTRQIESLPNRPGSQIVGQFGS
jgi:hypothetical protein